MNPIKKFWLKFWLNLPGPQWLKHYFTLIASIKSRPYYGRAHLADFSNNGYVSSRSTIRHDSIRLGKHVFIDDGVLIYQAPQGGYVSIDDNTRCYRDTILQTGLGGNISIGEDCHIQPRATLSAYVGSIRIGSHVQIGVNVGIYPYNHGFKPDQLIIDQPISSKGDIVIGNDVMIGYGAIILEGVTVGDGAVIGAGSVVMQSIPENALVFGNPARMFSKRGM